MNYRHIYHAGNFADVVKHVVLTFVIEHLKLKETPFRVIDTHAGIGIYDLTADEATRTEEWRDGIGRLIGPDAAPMPAKIEQALQPYLEIVRALNPPGALRRYPGSPRIARALLRPQDRLVVNELHPEDAAALRQVFARDTQTTTMQLDGWTALKSLLPPKERRGVILIDPPFEQPRELDRLVNGVSQAIKRFATGILLLWYPIKDPALVSAFHRKLVENGHERLLEIQFLRRTIVDTERLNGCGLVVANAPYQLDVRLAPVLSFLAERMSDDPRLATGGARAGVRWLSP